MTGTMTNIPGSLQRIPCSLPMPQDHRALPLLVGHLQRHGGEDRPPPPAAVRRRPRRGRVRRPAARACSALSAGAEDEARPPPARPAGAHCRPRGPEAGDVEVHAGHIVAAHRTVSLCTASAAMRLVSAAGSMPWAAAAARVWRARLSMSVSRAAPVAGGGSATKLPRPRTRVDGAQALERAFLAVGVAHGVQVHFQCDRHLPHGRHLVGGLQRPCAHDPQELFAQLHIDRDPGVLQP